MLLISTHIQCISDSGAESDTSALTGASIDPEDPMRDYLIAQRREAAAKTKKSKGKRKHKDETPEEKRARKAKKREKKEKRLKSAGMKGVEEILTKLSKRGDGEHNSEKVVYSGHSRHGDIRNMPSRHHEHSRSRERSPLRYDERCRRSDEDRYYHDRRH